MSKAVKSFFAGVPPGELTTLPTPSNRLGGDTASPFPTPLMPSVSQSTINHFGTDELRIY